MEHRYLDLADVRIFYREAGPQDAPVILLPHGYPCSSYQFRNLLPKLADRWRLLAPDFPGSGYSDTPRNFDYSFDGYAEFLDRFAAALGVERFALYLHDFGSQIGLRLAMLDPQRITALVIQNGDIYEDQLGPKYAPLEEYFRNPTAAGRAKLAEAVSEEGYREEFLNEVRPALAGRISPDLWKLHWALTTPRRREIYVSLIAGLRENLAWFPRYQSYLRTHQPPTLIVWGPQDGYMPEGAARAYLRDLPEAELHLLDGGHWLLETHLDEVAMHMRAFLTPLTAAAGRARVSPAARSPGSRSPANPSS
jgi:pimeloyl-ACP methyl ester carboxylesterase